MSILENHDLACPACGATMSFEVVHSVLADRRPDLRAAILNDSFQVQTCPECEGRVRRDPDLNYLDIGRGQWILAKSAAEVADWPALESQSLGLFQLGYGVLAPAPAQEIGRDLTVRVVFGWAALREKLLANSAGLDDAALELLKLNLMRTLDAPPVSDMLELRLVGVDAPFLEFVWLQADDGAAVERLSVPFAAYEQVAAEPELYRDLRDRLLEGPFVDMNRLLIEPSDREAVPA